MNQFHDILPGTAIHEVYEQTKKEYDAMAETISALSADRMQALAPQGKGITVFNTTGKTRSDVVVLENCTANALSDGKNTYPVQQTANGAVAFLPDLPPKATSALRRSKQAALKTRCTSTAHDHDAVLHG